MLLITGVCNHAATRINVNHCAANRIDVSHTADRLDVRHYAADRIAVSVIVLLLG